MPERIGFVGLGNMGAPMAARLGATGLQLTVHDARAPVARSLAERLGAGYAERVEDVAGASDVVITMLPDGAAVAAVARTLRERLAPGSLLVDMSSSAPPGTVELAAELGRSGIALVDAPVSGGVPRAQTGELSIMIGGDEADVSRALPLLAHLGTTLTHVGPIGAGHAMKALNNALAAVGLMAAAEALTVADRFGIDQATALRVLNASTGRNVATESKLEQFHLSGSYASGFALRLQVKDVATAIDLAENLGVSGSVLASCLPRLREAARALPPDADHTEVARWVAEHRPPLARRPRCSS
jgi:3-hydroxyisobutyrate dehydrogenase